MKNFVATTAVALILGTSAYAEGHTGAFSDMTFDAATNLNASELIGMRVYASEADFDGVTIAENGETEWDDIGEINEIVLTRDGEVQSVIVGVGGFLGIGEKNVAVAMDSIQFVAEDGDANDYFLVVNSNQVGVEEAPAYEYNAPMSDMDHDGMDTENADMDAAEVDETDIAEERTPLTAPMMERDGYATAMTEDLTAEDLTGARVYGVNDEDVGEVSELLVTADGTLDRAIIDVGGFLGLGEKPVSVPMDELQIIRSDDGSDFRVYIESSQEALEAQPEYEG